MTTNINAHNTSTERRLVGYAWPTGRPIYSYTTAEIAVGVDVYTQFLKRRNTIDPDGGEPDAA